MTNAYKYFFHFLREDCDGRIKELWLDHDLGSGDEDPIDVRPLVLMLEEAAYYDLPYRIDTIVICTDNPVGRSYIHAALDRYYHVVGTPSTIKWRLLK